MDINYLYKRDSEENRDDFFKSVSQNIYIANFRLMINIITFSWIITYKYFGKYRRQEEEAEEEEVKNINNKLSVNRKRETRNENIKDTNRYVGQLKWPPQVVIYIDDT